MQPVPGTLIYLAEHGTTDTASTARVSYVSTELDQDQFVVTDDNGQSRIIRRIGGGYYEILREN